MLHWVRVCDKGVMCGVVCWKRLCFYKYVPKPTWLLLACERGTEARGCVASHLLSRPEVGGRRVDNVWRTMCGQCARASPGGLGRNARPVSEAPRLPAHRRRGRSVLAAFLGHSPVSPLKRNTHHWPLKPCFQKAQ